MSEAAQLARALVGGLSTDPNRAIIEIGERAEALRSPGISVKRAQQILTAVSAWTELDHKGLRWTTPAYPPDTDPHDDLDILLKSIVDFRNIRDLDEVQEAVRETVRTEQAARIGETFGIAILSDRDKVSIRIHLGKIKALIFDSDLIERKKIALISKLAELELELETFGTKTDRFFAFLGDAAFALGEVGKNSKPFTDEVKKMMKIIYRGREDAEGVRLPSRGEERLLSAPDEDHVIGSEPN